MSGPCVVGLHHKDIVDICATEQEVFVLRWHPTAARSLQLLRAALDQEELTAIGPLDRLARAVSSVDLAEPVRAVTFRLAGGASLQLDRRLLMARSAFFHDMFSSGLREAGSCEVDLTSDKDVDEASLCVLLRFLLSDTWDTGENHEHDSETETDLAFRVRAFADRYCLSRLVVLAEARICKLLRAANVLSFLGRVLGTGGFLEDACWALLESDRSILMEENEAQLDELVSQNPGLAKRLLLWCAGSGGSRGGMN